MNSFIINKFQILLLVFAVAISTVSVAEEAKEQPSDTVKKSDTPERPAIQDAAVITAAPLPPSLPVITLKEAQDKALLHTHDIKTLRELKYQSDMAVYQAWSMLLPNIAAEGSIIRNQHEVVVALPTGQTLPSGEPAPPMEIVIQDLWAKSVGFGINLMLFNPQSIPIIKLAKDSVEKQRLQNQIAKNEILFAVTSAYYQVYAMEEMIKAAEENVAVAEIFLKHATHLKNAGQATKIDTNRAEMQVLNAKQGLEDTLFAQKQALVALKFLIGEDKEFELQGPEELAPSEKNLEALQQDAANRRLELKEASIQRAMAERARKQTLTKFLPVFDATYSWSWSSAGGFTGSNVNWMLIFGAKWTLLQGGYRIAEYQSRKSQIRMAEINAEKIVHQLKQEVETNYIKMRQHQRDVDMAEQKAELAENNYQLISKQFDAGIISSLEVSNASSELASSKLIRVYKRLLYDLSVLTLEKSAGEYNSLALSE